MAPPAATRLTAAQGRRFALTVGTAFLALAALAWWRGAAMVALGLAMLGGGLGLAGVLVPGHLTTVHRAWMGLASLLSRITTPLVLGVIYFGVITPIGLLRRMLGRNPLVHRASEGSYFVARAEGAARRSDLDRQF